MQEVKRALFYRRIVLGCLGMACGLVLLLTQSLSLYYFLFHIALGTAAVFLLPKVSSRWGWILIGVGGGAFLFCIYDIHINVPLGDGWSLLWERGMVERSILGALGLWAFLLGLTGKCFRVPSKNDSPAPLQSSRWGWILILGGGGTFLFCISDFHFGDTPNEGWNLLWEWGMAGKSILEVFGLWAFILGVLETCLRVLPKIVSSAPVRSMSFFRRWVVGILVSWFVLIFPFHHALFWADMGGVWDIKVYFHYLLSFKILAYVYIGLIGVLLVPCIRRWQALLLIFLGFALYPLTGLDSMAPSSPHGKDILGHGPNWELVRFLIGGCSVTFLAISFSSILVHRDDTKEALSRKWQYQRKAIIILFALWHIIFFSPVSHSILGMADVFNHEVSLSIGDFLSIAVIAALSLYLVRRVEDRRRWTFVMPGIGLMIIGFWVKGSFEGDSSPPERAFFAPKTWQIIGPVLVAVGVSLFSVGASCLLVQKPQEIVAQEMDENA